MSRLAGWSMPSPFRYHSLATSTYSLSACGSGFAGCTTIAPYMPLAMCASTGLVPQWYMKTPGSSAVKRKVNDSPGATSRKATFGAIRAAWKSIECGIAPPFFSVISTVWPSRRGRPDRERRARRTPRCCTSRPAPPRRPCPSASSAPSPSRRPRVAAEWRRRPGALRRAPPRSRARRRRSCSAAAPYCDRPSQRLPRGSRWRAGPAGRQPPSRRPARRRRPASRRPPRRRARRRRGRAARRRSRRRHRAWGDRWRGVERRRMRRGSWPCVGSSLTLSLSRRASEESTRPASGRTTDCATAFYRSVAVGSGCRPRTRGRRAGGAREDHEHAQTFVAGELVQSPGGGYDRLPGLDGNRLPPHHQPAAPRADAVPLVVVVRLLGVALWGDEHVDPHLQSRRGVDDLVAAVPGLEPAPYPIDVEAVCGDVHRTLSRTRLPLRVVSSTSQSTVDSTSVTPGTRATSRISRSKIGRAHV